MSELDAFKATYFDECTELLNELEEQFAAIEAGAREADRLNAVFRAIHSIKGGAGAFGFDGLVGFAHSFESLLDQVRSGDVTLSEEVVALCIRSADIVADHVAAARAGRSLPPDFGSEEQARFDALCAGGDDAGAPMEEFDIDFTPVAVDLDTEDDVAPEPETQGWRIRFAPRPQLFARANDPLLLLRALSRLGEAQITPEVGPLPDLDAFDSQGAYCAWEIALTSDTATEDDIREIFEFVDGDCDLDIAPLAGEEESDRLFALEDALPSFADLAAEADAERTFVADGAPDPEAVPAASGPVALAPAAPVEPESGPGRASGVQSIRVDLEKVDRVVDMVGELVIAQSMLSEQMDDTIRDKYQELVRGIEVLAQTTRGLQDAVMAIRAQPVKTVFSRMPRLVRELCTKTGKTIRLEMVGETTEIDKTVIEQLADPLTHMVRNCADHGVESPADRLAAGKPETGTIRLSAEQSGGNIVIAVEDDGAGINRERVLAVARERGVVAPDQQLSDEQIDNLIFAPGFSTASEISDISGRGVGMDVVLSNIQKIGGSVHVRAVPGKGTRMTLRLPLTLAVLDVMLVRVAGAPYVVPLSSIFETLEARRADFGHLPSGDRVLHSRGEYVRVLDLARHFALATQEDEASRFVVLCEADGAEKLALVVDEIIGQQQVVIKSLEENFERIEGIAGGTILGDGSVALIVDVQALNTAAGRRAAA